MCVRTWLGLILFVGFFVFFHVSEFLLAKWYHTDVSWRSTLISVPYLFVMSLVLIEYILEAIYWPEIKGLLPLLITGTALLIIGEIIRKSAIITAKVSFTHDIATEPSPKHKLVSKGIYSVMRHPSYCGWLVWVIGGQIVLTNIVTFFVVVIITWIFFYFRIKYEEENLKKIFGDNYIHYMHDVPFSGVPGVK